MINFIPTVLMIFFGIFTGVIFVLPLIFGMLDSQSHYLPFGIGTAVGVVISFFIAYALAFP